jgi:DNA primase
MTAEDGFRKGFFSSDSVERVRNSTDIAAVIGRFIELKKAGNSLKGLCPFHREKTPSFFVSRDRQTYHCFGCGAGGDVFSFLMAYLSMTFPDALEELASDAGIELEAPRTESSRSDGIRDILTDSHRFFQEQLAGQGGSAAREYLAGRDLSRETIAKLAIGWAPDGNLLTRHLRGRGCSDSQIEESGVGLRSRSDPAKVFDRFRSRVIFPITDRRGRIVSFGGRILPGASGDAPKYLNGPDTPLYRKGELLYGYRDAVRAARDLDMMMLVEGYFDHARLVQSGFGCTVATCGTALTAAQARQLGSASVDILICYDGDSAGKKAAVSAAEVILEQGNLPRIIRMPEGVDPDDFIAAEGADAVLRMASEALDPVRFALWLLGGWEDAGGPARRVKAVRRLVAIASRSTDPIIRETLLKIVAEETSYSMETVRKESEGESSSRKESRIQDRQSEELRLSDIAILGTILLSTEGLQDPLLESIEEGDMRSGAGVMLLQVLREQAAEGFRTVQLSGMDAGLASVCSRILAELPTGSEVSKARKTVSKWIRDRLNREIEANRRLLSEATVTEQEELLKKINAIGSKLIQMKSL